MTSLSLKPTDRAIEKYYADIGEKRHPAYRETYAANLRRVLDHKLGSRSALEWVIEQYRVATDKRSGIRNDPNRPDDEGYIVRLIGQVVRVSLETLKLVEQIAQATR